MRMAIMTTITAMTTTTTITMMAIIMTMDITIRMEAGIITGMGTVIRMAMDTITATTIMAKAMVPHSPFRLA